MKGAQSLGMRAPPPRKRPQGAGAYGAERSQSPSATDTLPLVLRDGPARISEEEKSGVILDYDADDRLIAIEILDASTRVDGVDTVQLQVTPKSGVKHPEAAE